MVWFTFEQIVDSLSETQGMRLVDMMLFEWPWELRQGRGWKINGYKFLFIRLRFVAANANSKELDLLVK